MRASSNERLHHVRCKQQCHPPSLNREWAALRGRYEGFFSSTFPHPLLPSCSHLLYATSVVKSTVFLFLIEHKAKGPDFFFVCPCSFTFHPLHIRRGVRDTPYRYQRRLFVLLSWLSTAGVIVQVPGAPCGTDSHLKKKRCALFKRVGCTAALSSGVFFLVLS
jgi:hypothetical protein